MNKPTLLEWHHFGLISIARTLPPRVFFTMFKACQAIQVIMVYMTPPNRLS
jgi:hypothetical protein